MEPVNLGTFSVGDQIPEVTGALGPGEVDVYIITFSESVVLSGTLQSIYGDPDITIKNLHGNPVFIGDNIGDEDINQEQLSAGPYGIEITSGSALESYSMVLSIQGVTVPGTCADPLIINEGELLFGNTDTLDPGHILPGCIGKTSFTNVYMFIPTITGHYEIFLSDPDFDSVLYLVDGMSCYSPEPIEMP